MNALVIENDGPAILKSNYWDTDVAQHGKLYLSTNAGAFRLLLPDCHQSLLAEMSRHAKHVVLSWVPVERQKGYAVEWMVEDGSDTPWACHLSAGAVDRLPLIEDQPKPWRGTVWVRGPRLALDLPAYCRQVRSLPCLKPYIFHG